VSPETWAEPEGKWLTTSQGDFSTAFQKHPHNLHDFFPPYTVIICAFVRTHNLTHTEMLKNGFILAMFAGLEILVDF